MTRIQVIRGLGPWAGYCFLTFHLVFAFHAAAGTTPFWAHGIGGASEDFAEAIDVDGAGNIYVTGFFVDTVDFDPGPGEFNFTSAGGGDVFVMKLDSDGSLVWAAQVEGEFNDEAFGVRVAGDGSVYVTGWFSGAADFDPGPGDATISPSGCFNAFLWKLDGDGNFLWVKQFGDNAAGAAVDLDAEGNVYIAGTFIGDADFDPGEGASIRSAVGEGDAYLVKLDADGNHLWDASFGGAEDDQPEAISAQGSRVALSGWFAGTGDFDPGDGTTNLTSAGGDDAFAVQLSTDGALQWAAAIGGPGADQALSISADASGRAILSGFFSDTADFDPGAATLEGTSAGATDAFILALGSNGALEWAKPFGGPGADSAHDVYTNADNAIYAAGSYSGAVDFEAAPSLAKATAVGGTDAFALKLGSTGAFGWLKSFGGADADEALAITADDDGAAYLAGTLSGTADFDPSDDSLPLTSNGSMDFFITKQQDETIPTTDPLDINGDEAIDAVDVQLVINAVLGINISPFSGDVNASGSADAIDVQLVINAVLGIK